MAEYRISAHPILSPEPHASVTFLWEGRQLTAHAGETIASALFANGIRVFGHHPKDSSPQGIFCANGQCAQCLVLADGMPVKSCMTPVKSGLQVRPVDALPELPRVATPPAMREIARARGPGADHRRGSRGHVRRGSTGTAGRPLPAGGRQGPARRQAGAANPSLLRFDQRGVCGDPGHRHREQARGAGRRVPRPRSLAEQHRLGRVQRPQGGHSAALGGRGRRRVRARQAAGAAGCSRRPREVAGISREHSARRLWRGRIPNAGQPRPRAGCGAPVHRRGRERRPHRRLPRAASGHPGRGAGGGAARVRRLQGA